MVQSTVGGVAGSNITAQTTTDLALEKRFFPERLDAGKENANDNNIKGAPHAPVQARSCAPGGQRPKHCGGDAYAGVGQSGAVQLGQGASPRKTQGRRQQARKCRVDGEQPAMHRIGTGAKMKRDILKKATASFARGPI